jgi:AcrR family transcriptional regulator
LHLELRGVNILPVDPTEGQSAGRTYRGADAAQRRDERRTRLIGAAVEVFGTEGYRTATVEKLCATAGLTKRYFYESFSGSEELLLASYDHAIGVLLSSLRAGAATGTDTESRLDGALTAFFATVEADPRLARLAFFEILGVSERVDRAYRDATRAFIEVLLTTDEPIFRRALPPEAHPRVVATGLVGAVLMIAQQWLLAPQPIDTAVVAARTILTAVLSPPA